MSKQLKKEELIKKMKGAIIDVSYNWLIKNDNGLIDWITHNKYWGRGFEDKIIPVKNMVVRLEFDDQGVKYYATFKGHPEGVEQSLSDQPVWGEDEYTDWPVEDLKKYYKDIKKYMII